MNDIWQYLIVFSGLGLALRYCWMKLVKPVFFPASKSCGSTSCHCEIQPKN